LRSLAVAELRESAVASQREDPARVVAREQAEPAGLAAVPAQIAGALARSDAASREEVIARLQSAGGNHGVGQLLDSSSRSTTPGPTRTETLGTVRYPFTATIRRAPVLAAAAPAAPRGRADSPKGAEHPGPPKEALFEEVSKPEAAAAAKGPPAAAPAAGAAPGSGGAGAETTSGSAATPGAAPTAAAGAETTPAAAGPAPAGPEGGTGGGGTGEGTRTKLPDIHLPALAEVERCDAVAGILNYNGSITRGGAQPSGFGVTRSFSSSLTNITLASTASVYIVTATLEHPITYQIRSGTGPDGQVDIPSADAAAITAANWNTVVSDLTPNMSDLNGRPPRSQFWAEDLTVQHELVHAHDDNRNGPLAMMQAMAWLNGQTASSVVGLAMLLSSIPGRFAANLLAALSTEDGEKHAYGDGVANYTARANAVSAKGGRGEYH
jgi:hypothetical protein